MPERPAALHCIVYGRVQGVGFRFFVVDHAERLGLTGWVRNRPDGRSVELVAEGTPDQLDALRAAIAEGPPGAWVERIECRPIEPTGAFTGFSIRR